MRPPGAAASDGMRSRMAGKRLSNVAGFDDAPFPRTHRGIVPIVGTVYAGLRFDGVVIGQVQKDGLDAAHAIYNAIAGSRFAGHVQLILLQGIALGGFNVVDVFELNKRLSMPILVVSRRPPDLSAIKDALLGHIPGGAEKWRIIEQLGPMEPAGNVQIQRVGLSFDQASAVIARFAVHGHVPEPLRTAHIIAGALATGQSRGSP